MKGRKLKLQRKIGEVVGALLPCIFQELRATGLHEQKGRCNKDSDKNAIQETDLHPVFCGVIHNGQSRSHIHSRTWWVGLR